MLPLSRLSYACLVWKCNYPIYAIGELVVWHQHWTGFPWILLLVRLFIYFSKVINYTTPSLLLTVLSESPVSKVTPSPPSKCYSRSSLLVVLLVCMNSTYLISDFTRMRTEFNARYVRLYSWCDDDTNFFNDVINAAYQVGIGVYATVWFGWVFCLWSPLWLLPFINYYLKLDIISDSTEQINGKPVGTTLSKPLRNLFIYWHLSHCSYPLYFRQIHWHPTSFEVSTLDLSLSSTVRLSYYLYPFLTRRQWKGDLPVDQMVQQIQYMQQNVHPFGIGVAISEMQYGFTSTSGSQAILNITDFVHARKSTNW